MALHTSSLMGRMHEQDQDIYVTIGGRALVSCPAPSTQKARKGSGQTCIAPVSQRNAIIELPVGVNKEARCDY